LALCQTQTGLTKSHVYSKNHAHKKHQITQHLIKGSIIFGVGEKFTGTFFSDKK
jgi:hypothetical protein